MSNPLFKYFFVIVTASWVLCLDQASKLFIHTQFPRQEAKALIKGFFNISYVTNSGGAFGLFNGGPEWIRILLFILIPLICFVFIFAMLRDTKQPLPILALSFILGGALGNYVDRVRLGYVVDFLDLHVKSWHWPTFNFADSFIVIGVALLSFLYFKDYWRSKNFQSKD